MILQGLTPKVTGTGQLVSESYVHTSVHAGCMAGMGVSYMDALMHAIQMKPERTNER